MKRPGGFTLLEVILATLILSIIGTLTWGALSATFKTQKTISERSLLQEIGTTALWKIRDDLSQTFIVEAARQITFFTGESTPDQDKLAFTSFAHIRSGPNVHEADQTIVTYETQSDPAGGKLKILKRSENRYLTSDKNDIAESVTLATNVVSFKLEYSDGQKYFSTWDSKSPEQRNKLPKSVKVALVLQDEKEREETYEAIVEIPMSETIGVDQAAAGAFGAQTAGARPTVTPTPSVTPSSQGTPP